jgi:hypothetical protein
VQQVGHVHAEADRVNEAQRVQALREALDEARGDERAIGVADDAGLRHGLGVEDGQDLRRHLVDTGDAGAGRPGAGVGCGGVGWQMRVWSSIGQVSRNDRPLVSRSALDGAQVDHR